MSVVTTKSQPKSEIEMQNPVANRGVSAETTHLGRTWTFSSAMQTAYNKICEVFNMFNQALDAFGEWFDREPEEPIESAHGARSFFRYLGGEEWAVASIPPQDRTQVNT